MIDLPSDAKARKEIPITTGLIDYFPAALAAVANLSKVGNDQHNPGQPLNWARGKSTDQADTIVRHLMQRGTLDTDGVRHSTKVAWRALALLQEELEKEAGFKPDSKIVLEQKENFVVKGKPETPDSCPIGPIIDSIPTWQLELELKARKAKTLRVTGGG